MKGFWYAKDELKSALLILATKQYNIVNSNSLKQCSQQKRKPLFILPTLFARTDNNEYQNYSMPQKKEIGVKKKWIDWGKEQFCST